MQILIAFTSAIATAVIITEVVLGYSNFTKINDKPSVITLAEGCQ
jgi:hypothetical protein